ncbi:MAG: copper homeostasis protein CutC [Bacteroidetes bacterium]|nr:MAG: copper homeostasis protein CutC [Bacteroidota bacterium]
MKNNPLIEVCATNIQSALTAQKGGAKRIELCDNLFEGGTTPSPGTLQIARELLEIEINVMIRPRGSDFYYSDLEFEIMKRDIEFCKKLGVDGVVFGILLPDGNVDIKRLKQLVQLSSPMSITFHRAFDMTPNPFQSLEEIIELGIDRILTAGQKNTAIEGKKIIGKLISKAEGRIIIMPGSGINEDNILELKKGTGATEFHLSGHKKTESKMTYRKNGIFMGGIPQVPEYEIRVTDENHIREIIRLITVR